MAGRIVRASLFLLGAGAIAGFADDAWNNLKQVTHRRSYVFALRDGTCPTGKIVAVTVDSVKIDQPDPATLKRVAVVRVSDGAHAYNAVYSSRSSWSDVAAIPSSEKTFLRVVTKAGKQYEGSADPVGESGMTLVKGGKTVNILKNDVAQVYYVRLKPLSDSARYSDEESFPLNPELWPYYWNIGVHMAVLLYDSSVPEDNSMIVCPAGER